MTIRCNAVASMLAPFLLGITAGMARADIMVDYSTSSNQAGVTERVQFAIKDDVLRFSVAGAAVTADYYLYYGSSRRLLYFQPQRNAYYELRPGMLGDTTQVLQSQRDDLARMLEELDGLDEQTRQRIETALESIDTATSQVGEYANSMQQSRPRLGPSRGEITLDGMSCTLYPVTMVQAELEACYAEPEELGLSAAHAALIQQFQERLTASTGMANMYSLVPGRLPLVAAYGSLDQPEALVVRFEGATEMELPNAGFIIPDSYSEVNTQMPGQ